MSATDDVRAALPVEFESASQICRQMGFWSPRTVRDILVALYQTGQAERTTKPYDGRQVVHLYRRVRAKLAA